MGGNKVSANNGGFSGESSDGETYAAKKFGGAQGVRRMMADSEEDDNILRTDSVMVSKGGNMNRAN